MDPVNPDEPERLSNRRLAFLFFLAWVVIAYLIFGGVVIEWLSAH